MNGLCLESLAKNGYACFSSNAGYTTLDIAEAIGFIDLIPGYQTVQKLIPRENEHLESSSYSGNFGKGAFPLHTDMAHWFIPPRYFLLRCINPAASVYTRFLHTSQVLCTEDRDDAKRALFRPRRRLDGRLTLLRLQDDEIFRWDTLFLKPMSQRAVAFQDYLARKIAASPLEEVALSHVGDSVLIDNWNVLHGRSSVPEAASNRVIERAYLSGLKENSNAES